MTTATDAERFPPLTPEVLAARDAYRAELAELLDAAPKILRDVTTTVIYDVVPPVPLPRDHRRLIVAVEAHVTRTHDGGSPGRVRVRAWHRARTASGQPRANGGECEPVAASLAGALIVRALRS